MNDTTGENEGTSNSLLQQKTLLERAQSSSRPLHRQKRIMHDLNDSYCDILFFNKLRFQHFLDEVTPFVQYRWIATAILLVLFMLRIILAEGWYIVTYALGIYMLNLFLAFLTPKLDPSAELDTQETEMEEGPSLPVKNDEEFKPFIRRLPEFKFWYATTKATVIALVCSFFRIFDIPVYWPILLVYFCILFAITMRRQIKHMIKYRYIPFDLNKRQYASGSSSRSN